MGILKPFFLVGRTFNTAANLYLVGQVGWWAYKQYREVQGEKLKAGELKARFIEEYRAEHGTNPPEELVSLALRSYNVVERPLQERVKRIFGRSA